MATLAEVNARLKKTNIKGKSYVEVNQRILAFWELYPSGRIVTEKLSDDGERCDFKAYVYNGETLLATGHSFEKQSAGMINRTSYIENCETSAVGRALGMLGIGATESIASADEVQSAIEQQQQSEAPKEDALQAAKRRLWQAEQLFCEKYEYSDAKAFHTDMIEPRKDYKAHKNDPETLNNIADELLESAGEK